jgi:DNA polymerase
MSEKREKLINLRTKMKGDKTLPLREGATNLVFGEGSPNAKVLFIGEGPGRWEDLKGRPFVGNAGSLLNKLLQSIELDRKRVFITNTVFYRPPNNRDPLPEELEAFGRYLDQIIAIINPKVIVTLGRFSMGKFLPNVKISSVHGKKFTVDWKGKEMVIVPMYHPAAGLRRTAIRDSLFEDFKKLQNIIKEETKATAEQMKLT